MQVVWIVAIALVVVGLVYYVARTAGRAYLKARGARVVNCPDTGQTVAVEVDARSAAWKALWGVEDTHLCDCTHWPEKAGCGQQCLEQIERAPNGCRVRTFLESWYSGAECALCHRPFGTIHWHDHKPCLMAPDGKTFRWDEIAPEAVPEALKTYRPVCWNCHVAQSFRQEYPGRVVERGR